MLCWLHSSRSYKGKTWTSLYMIFIKKSRIPLWCIPYCLFPGRIVTWAWSLAKGQYMVSWLLTGAPEQRYWQNRETANVGLDSSVGRAPVRQSGGRRFKSRSSQFSLFIQIYLSLYFDILLSSALVRHNSFFVLWLPYVSVAQLAFSSGEHGLQYFRQYTPIKYNWMQFL